jgi:hypothetical protein
LQDAESKETHDDWDPRARPVSWKSDSVLFSVQPSVDGDVEFEIWRGGPESPLTEVLCEGSIALAHGRILMRSPDDDFKVEIYGLGRGGPVSIMVDDVAFPSKVQVALLF